MYKMTGWCWMSVLLAGLPAPCLVVWKWRTTMHKLVVQLVSQLDLWMAFVILDGLVREKTNLAICLFTCGKTLTVTTTPTCEATIPTLKIFEDPLQLSKSCTGLSLTFKLCTLWKKWNGKFVRSNGEFWRTVLFWRLFANQSQTECLKLPHNFLKFVSLGPFAQPFDLFGPRALHTFDVMCCMWPWRVSCGSVRKGTTNWHRCEAFGQSGMSSNMFLQISSMHSTHLQPSYTCICDAIFGLVKRVCISTSTKRQTAKTRRNGKTHVIFAWRRKLCTFGFPRYIYRKSTGKWWLNHTLIKNKLDFIGVMADFMGFMWWIFRRIGRNIWTCAGNHVLFAGNHRVSGTESQSQF